MSIYRQAITVRGVVQGVGFRPFVYGLASRYQLTGFVKNRGGSLVIEVEGERQCLDQFLADLKTQHPPLAIIDDVSLQSMPLLGEHRFRIEASEADLLSPISIAPDIATCADCLAELFDPTNRRFRYPIINCTNCGPRLTIIVSAPYDRERTTMAPFEMCKACRTEFELPENRRFHAQATACPVCGPQLVALDRSGAQIVSQDPLAVFIAALRAGKIGAMKGLGGFHLVCDARQASVVDDLRRLKQRDEKPFAIMVRDLNVARSLCVISPSEQALLESPSRPIVLLAKENAQDSKRIQLADAVSPNNPFLGVMLPFTPLHHLLFDEVGDVPLVMTSGNRSDEPIAYSDVDVVERLGDIADVFLTHNRPIQVRCDDSVTRVVAKMELPVRRSRGYAPQPIQLPFECSDPVLAVGGQLKNVFALGYGRQAILSHHMGDLDHFGAFQSFQRDITLYENLFEIRARVIAHDLHPDYASTGYAQQRATRQSLKLLPVQHHHAHMASCMAENSLSERAIGVTFDGTGYGTDGTIWGGEFLVGDYSQFIRVAHLRCVRMPGGEQAIKEPWRMALSHLQDAGCDFTGLNHVSKERHRIVEQMLERDFNAPFTSSAGRLFDAVAALAGLAIQVNYEGQAAMQLEWRATEVAEDRSYPFELIDESDLTDRRPAVTISKRNPTPFYLDTRPLIWAVVQDRQQNVNVSVIARRFHSTIVAMISAACERIRSQTGLNLVVLSGGVFLNALLTEEVCVLLTIKGFRVYRHRLVPPGDGGLCLGQLAIAARACDNDLRR